MELEENSTGNGMNAGMGMKGRDQPARHGAPGKALTNWILMSGNEATY